MLLEWRELTISLQFFGLGEKLGGTIEGSGRLHDAERRHNHAHGDGAARRSGDVDLADRSGTVPIDIRCEKATGGVPCCAAAAPQAIRGKAIAMTAFGAMDGFIGVRIPKWKTARVGNLRQQCAPFQVMKNIPAVLMIFAAVLAADAPAQKLTSNDELTRLVRQAGYETAVERVNDVNELKVYGRNNAEMWIRYGVSDDANHTFLMFETVLRMLEPEEAKRPGGMLALLQAFNPQKQATEFRIENQTVYSLGSPSEKPSEKSRKSVPAIVLLTGVANRANTVEDVRTAVIRLMKAAEATEPVWVRK